MEALQHHGEVLAAHNVKLETHDRSLAALERKIDRLTYMMISLLAATVFSLVRHG